MRQGVEVAKDKKHTHSISKAQPKLRTHTNRPNHFQPFSWTAQLRSVFCDWYNRRNCYTYRRGIPIFCDGKYADANIPYSVAKAPMWGL